LISKYIADAVLNGQAQRDGENASEEAIAVTMGDAEYQKVQEDIASAE
jgi:hypothetical protein